MEEKEAGEKEEEKKKEKKKEKKEKSCRSYTCGHKWQNGCT